MSKAFILKDQKIPESQKTKEWDMSHVHEFLAFSGTGILTNDLRKQDQIKCWKYYFGIIDKEQEQRNKVVTNPYQYSLGMEYVIYPLIESKVEQVVGEYLTRPVKKKTYVINKRARSKKLDQLHSMVAEDILREFNQEFKDELGFVPSTEQPDKELPEDIEDFIENGNFKTQSEEISDIILEQVLEVKNNKRHIKNLLVDALVQDEAIAFIGEKDGHPSIERCSTFETILDWDPNEEVQKDPQYFIRTKYMSYNEIINTFDLKPEEERVIKDYSNFANTMDGLNSYFAVDGFDDRLDNRLWFQNTDNIMRVRLVEMIWISKRQIKVRVSINKKTGKEIYKVLPEDSKKKGPDIKSIWVDYKRKVLMCGPNLILEHGPDEERNTRIDDLKKDTINAVGYRRNNFLNSRIRSLAMKLLQLQDMASEALFEARLAMRRNTGRVLVYDAAQIPKQFLKSGGYENAMNRVMHHAKKDQFLIINSQDKGVKNSFNQFQSLDLSTRGMFQDIINYLALIENLADKFSGLSQERQGQIDQYQTAQGAERAVAQSTARTEVYIAPFDDMIEAILEKIILKGKHTYEENEIVEYIFGDNNSKFFTVYPGFFQDDIGVKFGNNFKENKTKGIIDQAANNLFNNAQTPEMILDLIDVVDADTAAEAKKILRKGIKAVQALQQQNQEAMKQAEEIKAKAEKERQDAEHKVKREGFDKDIAVAEIQAGQKTAQSNNVLQAQKVMKLADIEKDLMSKQKSN